ncbi:hypothetical protein H5410_037375 [Solanum commersonii]|uniref:Ubiquinone biosynthesis protein n=1 Tax=Solanum commersonii TaxID=4109 RepID=A0A9J5Y8B1_SOLCO|nr:hypothetical protein H5410_037375 [Solanum commersonii]
MSPFQLSEYFQVENRTLVTIKIKQEMTLALEGVFGMSSSYDFRDTWAFLDARTKDAFDLKKTAQEAQRLAEAVGAGMGGSVQGFMKRVFTG